MKNTHCPFCEADITGEPEACPVCHRLIPPPQQEVEGDAEPIGVGNALGDLFRLLLWCHGSLMHLLIALTWAGLAGLPFFIFAGGFSQGPLAPMAPWLWGIGGVFGSYVGVARVICLRSEKAWPSSLKTADEIIFFSSRYLALSAVFIALFWCWNTFFDTR